MNLMRVCESEFETTRIVAEEQKKTEIRMINNKKKFNEMMKKSSKYFKK